MRYVTESEIKKNELALYFGGDKLRDVYFSEFICGKTYQFIIEDLFRNEKKHEVSKRGNTCYLKYDCVALETYPELRMLVRDRAVLYFAGSSFLDGLGWYFRNKGVSPSLYQNKVCSFMIQFIRRNKVVFEVLDMVEVDKNDVDRCTNG